MRAMRFRLFAATLFAAAAAFGQVRETVNVNIVEVPVTVVDSSGDPIRGLTAANFELLDQGKKREISSFDKIDFAAPESVSAISPLNPAARRSFLLLFDLGFSAPNALTRAQDAARRFVKENVQPRDLVAVGTIEVERGFRLLSAFTTDRELIASAIRDPLTFKGTDPLQLANQTVVYRPEGETVSDSGSPRGAVAGIGENQRAALENMREIAAVTTRANEAAVRQRIEKQVDSLGQLARTLRAVPGRKQIIFLSEGFDAKFLQGRDARATREQREESAAVLSGQVWKVDNDARYGSTSSLSILDRMAQVFRQSDVVLNAIDIQGVRVQNDIVEGSRINSNAGLFMLSRPTGGEIFQNTNDLKQNFSRMLHRQEVVYVLAFQAPMVKPGAFHDLKVRLIDVPGTAHVSHRAGYYEGGGENAAERTLSDAEIIVNDIPQDDVRVSALAAAFPVAGANAQVPVILEMNGADLAKEAKNNSATAEIYVYAFDSDGVVRDRLYHRLSLDMKKIGDRLRATGVRYYGTLSLPPGTYAVKSLVRAGENEKRGFVRTNVTVAKANEVAVLPPIPIDEAPKWLLVKGAPRVNAPYPFEFSGQAFIPSASVHTGQQHKIALFVYGAQPDELTWETTPKTRLLGQAAAGGVTKYIVQLDDAGSAPALNVTVRRKGAAEPLTTSVAVARQ
jgi:VWFA-related protein